MRPLSLWLVEDEPTYRDRFRELLVTTDEFRLDAAFERYEDLVPAWVALAPEAGPDLVVMDLQLPGTSGFDATRDLHRRMPDLPVVVLTLLDDAPSVFDALRAGASGYVVKGTAPEQTFRALREAYEGGTYFAPSVARHVLGHFTPQERPEPPLSDREREVLVELAAGRTKAGIAERLYLSPHTVDTHMRNVYRKLHVGTAAEATAKAIRDRIIL